MSVDYGKVTLMARYKHFYILIVLVMLGVCFNLRAERQATDVFAERYYKAVNLVKHNYIEPKSDWELFNSAMEGMISSLDNHSQFMKIDDIRQLDMDISGELEGGIGVEINLSDDDRKVTTVVTPIKGTPAYDAGLFAGDEIIEVAGVNIEGWELDKVVEKLRGQPGSYAALTIRRSDGKTSEKLSFSVKREVISISSVRGAGIIDEELKIGYLYLRNFQNTTPEELRSAVESLLNQGMKALVLDLRGNTGGTLRAGEEVGNMFIDKGIIVSVKYRNPEENEEIRATETNTYTKDKLPMVLLVDDGTASSSEIVAGALQDHGRAVLIGRQTYGKGSVQKIFYLDRTRKNHALRLTVAKYFTPNGRLIHRERRYKPGDVLMNGLIDEMLNMDEKQIKDLLREIIKSRDETSQGGLTPDIIIDEKVVSKHMDDIKRWWQERWVEMNRSPESKTWHMNFIKNLVAQSKKKAPPFDPFVQQGIAKLKSILVK